MVSRSSTSTSRPRARNARAAERPSSPPPITTTSVRCRRRGSCDTRRHYVSSRVARTLMSPERSVEVAGAETFREADRQAGDAARDQVGHALVLLEDASDAQRGRAAGDGTKALPHALAADHVHETGLVLEVQ